MRELGKKSQLRYGVLDLAEIWWMIPLGVKNNRTKFSPKLNGGSRERVSRVADLQFRAKNSFFCPKPP